MLRTLNDLQDYTIGASDGTIGQVKDFYFDDHAWVIRYLVVDTGGWLSGRKVLISPVAIGRPDWLARTLPVNCSMEQVRNSPEIDTERPVSRQHEMNFLSYYGYPYYWVGPGLWGTVPFRDLSMPGFAGAQTMPPALQTAAAKSLMAAEAVQRHDDDPHLRSCAAVTGYHALATDGDIGHIAAILVEEDSWVIRYLVIDTSNWWLGHQVLVAPQWVGEVRWADATVAVRMSRAAVRAAPPYDSTAALDRVREIAIYEHYGRPVYWVGGDTGAASPRRA